MLQHKYPSVVMVALFALLSTTPSLAAERRIAVNNFTADPEGSVSRVVLDALADETRRAAVDVLPREQWMVLTREAQETILREQDIDPTKLCEAECEVDVARVIGADVLITGKVVKIGSSLRLTVKLFDAEKASVLKIVTDKDKDAGELLDRLYDLSVKMIEGAIPRERVEAKLCAELARGWTPKDPGVSFEKIDAGRAVPACAAAVKADEKNLDFVFFYGRALDKAGDEVEAVRWYRKAADRGHASAQSNLGAMYGRGRGVVKDDDKAVRWYRKAADQGDAVAQSNLGFMFADGRGVAEDDVEALRWYRKSADQGHPGGQVNLASMYRFGLVVPNNDAEAVRWYRKAADQGDAEAQFGLGEMYSSGKGVVKDDAEAVRWYLKAADSGSLFAPLVLGTIYMHGRGVAKDPSEALRWLVRVKDQETAGDQSEIENIGIRW